MIDDEKIRAILDALPDKRPRSRLEPYCRLIDELRSRGRTYREIERILFEEFHVHAPRSTINDFVRVRLRPKRNPPKCRPSKLGKKTEVDTTAQNEEREATRAEIKPSTADEIYQRIAALKQRPASIPRTAKVFRYDPNEPLHLLQKARPKKTGESI